MVKYIRNNDNITSRIKDEIVMVNVTLSNYFLINPVGSSIWKMLEKEHSFEEIHTKLMEEYEIDKETCENEAQVFLDKLLELQLIQKII